MEHLYRVFLECKIYSKVASYKTRKGGIVNGRNENVLFCFKGMVSARTKLERTHHVNMGSLLGFEELWSNGGVLCKYIGNEVCWVVAGRPLFSGFPSVCMYVCLFVCNGQLWRPEESTDFDET